MVSNLERIKAMNEIAKTTAKPLVEKEKTPMEKFDEWIKQGEKIHKELEKEFERIDEKIANDARISIYDDALSGTGYEDLCKEYGKEDVDACGENLVRYAKEQATGSQELIFFNDEYEYEEVEGKVEQEFEKIQDEDEALEKKRTEIEEAIASIEEIMENWLGQEEEE